MRIKIVLLIAILVPAMSLHAQIPPASPEAAVELFMRGVKQASFETILAASACTEAAEGFDFTAFTDHMGILIPHIFHADSNNDFYRTINRNAFEATIAQQVKVLSWALLLGGDIPLEGASISDSLVLERFQHGFDVSKLRGLKLISIDFPHDSLKDSERNLANWRRNAGFYGADEYTERVALFSFDKLFWYTGFTLVRYGSTWKVLSMNSSLGNTSALGSPTRCTMESYLYTFKDASPAD
jgi:hypothetical protein